MCEIPNAGYSGFAERTACIGSTESANTVTQARCRKAALIGASAAPGVAAAPLTSADGADGVINDLQNKGYNVQINWVNGFDTQQLSDCTVTGVDNPDGSGPKSGDTVYVNVSCLNHPDGFGFGFGFGAGLG